MTTTSHTRTVSPVLDFEVSRLGTIWTVFDARTAKDLATGTGAGKADCVARAMGEIADRTPARLYALKHEGSWVVRTHGMWAPLPLTPAATTADVFAFLQGREAKGRQIEVIDLPALVAAV